ncbi:porin, partial [Prochlorococcus sp. AH-736-B08]|nr:porin [Prochlorococcus sp. AH-736-B08]
MKLFKSLLVAPATLGLLAPLSATANEVTVSDFVPAEELAVTNSRVDGLEARLNDFEAGSFSSTTTASFSVDMAIGAVESNLNSEALSTAYGYQMDLSTSFTGEDTLAVAIDAGAGAAALDELDLNATTGDELIVDGITYSFPVGDKITVLVGDSTDASALYSTACVYGGFTNTLDDCGIPNTAIESPDNGVALSASYDIGNGFTGAIGYAGQGTANEGLGTEDGLDFYGGQLTYTGDSYGASVTYANLDVGTAWGLNGYYSFA